MTKVTENETEAGFCTDIESSFILIELGHGGSQDPKRVWIAQN